jgi:hypothetical protein
MEPVVKDREADGHTVHGAEQYEQVHKRRLLFYLNRKPVYHNVCTNSNPGGY